jgi:DNA-binding transcriptional MerR regulator
MKDLLHVAEAASLLRVHPETVRRLDRRGILKGDRDHLNYRVFKLADVLRYREKRLALRAVGHSRG